MELALALCLAFVFYTYIGYPALLWALADDGTPPALPNGFRPSVTVVIAAYNEADCIGEAVASVLASDYPTERLNVIVVSDASNDGTDEAVAGLVGNRVQLLRQNVRQGQTSALRRGAQAAQADIVVLADASGRFLPGTVRALVRHFQDAGVGAVSGYNGIGGDATAVSKGDGAYARYDRLLRWLESRTGSSWVGCQGGLFAIRKPLFRLGFPLHMAADNATCYQLYEQGYRHRFDPEAMVLERPPHALADEFRRKIRIIVLQLHGIFHFRRLFVPWKHPQFFFQNASHKMFRWLVPFALILLAVGSGLRSAPWARALFWLQVLFYALAAAGIAWGRRRKAPWFLSIPAYFVTVNAAGLLAWILFFRDYTVWTPPNREREDRPLKTASST